MSTRAIGGGSVEGLNDVLLNVESVYVRYGGVHAVRGASLRVDVPEIVGLIGPNGAGKSSLLAAIGGQAEIASGSVRLLGRDVTNLGVHKRARLGIVRTFQSASVFDRLTVFENLMVAGVGHAGAALRQACSGGRGTRDAATAARADALRVLDEFELTDMIDSYGAELSGGQRRLVEMARCLMYHPKLLLFDEPMVGVAPHLVRRIGETCQRIRQSGVPIILVEHALEVVEALSDRVVIMAAGEVIEDGRYEDVLKNQSVTEAYLA